MYFTVVERGVKYVLHCCLRTHKHRPRGRQGSKEIVINGVYFVVGHERNGVICIKSLQL